MTIINTDRIIGFYAPSRYGKTNAIANLMLSVRIPVVIYDTNFEWANIPELMAIVNAQKNIIVHEPNKARVSDIDYLNEFIDMIRKTNTNLFIYVEDIETFYNEKTDYTKFYGAVKDISERGGHSRIGFIYSAKELKYIPRPLISNASLFYFGQFIEQKDISQANGICKPDYDVRQVHKPQFIKVDRWTMEKKIVTFNKVF